MSNPPNILFIYSDQHRADVMGCAGNDTVVTPNLDRLAAEGARFSQTWTESPICQPARASVLTGQFPTRHGILGNFAGQCEPEWTTYAKALQQAGYETAVIGKTHFANWPMGSKRDSSPPGEEWLKSFGFDYVLEEFDRYVHVGFETPYTQFLQSHGALEEYRSAVSDRFRIGDRHWEAATSPLSQEQDLTSFLTAEAERWLKHRSTDKPWFLNLSYVQPHVPLIGDPIWVEHYRDVHIDRTAPSIPESAHKAWAGHLALLRKHSHSELLTDEFVLAGARQYYAMVSLIDQKIGELLTTLEHMGELDNTMIIYASDHGEMLGDHGLMAKMNFYKSSVRIPLIIRLPGGGKATVYDKPVQAIDIVGSMLDAAGADPLPDSPAKSLLRVAHDPSYVVRDVANSMIRLRPELTTWVAVTDGSYRLTFDRATGEAAELFDLTTDPDEATNIVDQGHKQHIDRLREASYERLSAGQSNAR